MSIIQPPPTWTLPIDRKTGSFDPVWLKWFIDLASVLNQNSGGPTLAHNALGGLQGGKAGPPTEYYHLTSNQHGLFTTGTAHQVLHGDPTLPTWSSVSLIADVSGILPAGNGGTNNAFFQVSGPATTIKTFTLPNASDTIGCLGQAQTWTATQVIKGTATNDNAAAGYIGEYITAALASASSISLTTATPANVTSISLTAGDWDVTGIVDYTAGGATVVTALQQGSSATSATLGAVDTYSTADLGLTGPATDPAIVIPTVRYSLSGTTTIYLVTNAVFSVSTLKAYGTIRARRAR